MFSTHYPTGVYIFLFELCSQTESGIIKGGQLLPILATALGAVKGSLKVWLCCCAGPLPGSTSGSCAWHGRQQQRKNCGLNGWLNGVLSVHFCWADHRLWCVSRFIGLLSTNMQSTTFWRNLWFEQSRVGGKQLQGWYEAIIGKRIRIEYVLYL